MSVVFLSVRKKRAKPNPTLPLSTSSPQLSKSSDDVRENSGSTTSSGVVQGGVVSANISTPVIESEPVVESGPIHEEGE